MACVRWLASGCLKVARTDWWAGGAGVWGGGGGVRGRELRPVVVSGRLEVFVGPHVRRTGKGHLRFVFLVMLHM